MSFQEHPKLRTAPWFQAGYDVREVDAFLDEVAHCLTTGSAPPSIVDRRFAVRRFGGRYDMDDVDIFLDDLDARLRE